MSINKYYLGCPMWGNKAWTGSFFTSTAKPKDYLAQYSQVFNTVEGNTTFYGVPGPETIAKWRDAAEPSFRFAFKFPRTISHDLKLMDADREVDHFLKTLSPLGDLLGPFFLQLPPTFENFRALERFLLKLPRDFHYAIEPRHPAFYGDFEVDFVEMLTDLNMDRVIFDTRRLMSMETDDPELKDAQRRKPKSPVRVTATAQHPFLRYVGRPDPSEDQDAISGWARVIHGWITEGRTPYIFMHQAPDDDLAPQLGALFHQHLQQLLPEVGDFPKWPADAESKQLELF